MQVAGVQPVGSRGLGSVQAVVTDVKPVQPAAAASSAGPRGQLAAAHTVTAEPVVFPRDGLPTDRRPVHLRQTKAASRYREAQALATDRRPHR